MPNHVSYQPQRALAPFVEAIWATDDYEPGAPRERVMPSGWAAVVLHLEADPVRVQKGERILAGHAMVCGASTEPMVLHTKGLGASIGLLLKPGGVRALTKVAAAELAEGIFTLDDCLGRWGAELYERLLEEPDLQRRVLLFERLLLERARPKEAPAQLQEAVAAFEEADLPSVAEVNRRTGMSPKRLLALFRDEVGLVPKAYWRVRRFRAALRTLERGETNGAFLAAEHGYCDQSHLLREFRELGETTPREYLSSKIPGTDHIAVRE